MTVFLACVAAAVSLGLSEIDQTVRPVDGVMFVVQLDDAATRPRVLQAIRFLLADKEAIRRDGSMAVGIVAYSNPLRDETAVFDAPRISPRPISRDGVKPIDSVLGPITVTEANLTEVIFPKLDFSLTNGVGRDRREAIGLARTLLNAGGYEAKLILHFGRRSVEPDIELLAMVNAPADVPLILVEFTGEVSAAATNDCGGTFAVVDGGGSGEEANAGTPLSPSFTKFYVLISSLVWVWWRKWWWMHLKRTVCRCEPLHQRQVLKWFLYVDSVPRWVAL